MERIEPCTCVFPERDGKLRVEVQLPGVEKEKVTLDMKKDSFCVKGPKGEEAEYSGCFALPSEVEAERAEIGFERGRLWILAPVTRGWDEKVSFRPQA